jgi:hypothetical protein
MAQRSVLQKTLQEIKTKKKEQFKIPLSVIQLESKI